MFVCLFPVIICTINTNKKINYCDKALFFKRQTVLYNNFFSGGIICSKETPNLDYDTTKTINNSLGTLLNDLRFYFYIQKKQMAVKEAEINKTFHTYNKTWL